MLKRIFRTFLFSAAGILLGLYMGTQILVNIKMLAFLDFVSLVAALMLP